MPAPEYIPGTCNIGPAQLGIRRRAALYALTLFFVVTVSIFLFSDSRISRLYIFIPAAIAGVCVLQWAARFCVMFGIRGIFNVGSGSQAVSVEQKAYHRKDLIRAWQLIIGGIIAGALITAGIYYLPA